MDLLTKMPLEIEYQKFYLIKFMNHIIINIFITIFLLYSCSPVPKHVGLARSAITSFSKEVFQTDHLALDGSGGAMLDDIKTFTMFFDSQKNVDLAEARILFVNIVERFLNKINNDQEIRHFLHKFPITEKNIYLEIQFSPDNFNFHDRYVIYVSIPNFNPYAPTNRIHYKTANRDKNSTEFTYYNETYEEALKIVKEHQGQKN